MRGLSGVGRGTDAACGCADARGDPRISEAEGAEVKLLIYIYSYILLQRGWKKRRMNDARDVVVVVNGGRPQGGRGRHQICKRGSISVKNTYAPARVRHTNNNSFICLRHELIVGLLTANRCVILCSNRPHSFNN